MTKKAFLILIVIIVVLAAIWVGYEIGSKQGKEQADTQLSKIVEQVYPKPPEKINNLAGTIKTIYGATIDLEVTDPNDYLPHADGSKQDTNIRYASVTPDTKILLIDATQIDSQGNPKITEIKLLDLKEGDVVSVRSNENIKDAKKFDVYQIELVKY